MLEWPLRWEAVVVQVMMAAASGWRVAKYGKCSGTLAYLTL